MAHDHNMFVGIEFLMGSRGDVAHRYMLRAFEVRRFVLPGLADIEQSEGFAAFLQRLHLAERDFEVHGYRFPSDEVANEFRAWSNSAAQPAPRALPLPFAPSARQRAERDAKASAR